MPQATSWAQVALKPILALLFPALVSRPFVLYSPRSCLAAHAVPPLPVCRRYGVCSARSAPAPDDRAGRGSGLRTAGLISFRSTQLFTAGRQRYRAFHPTVDRFSFVLLSGVVGLGHVLGDRLGSSFEAARPPFFQARSLSLHPFRQSGCSSGAIRVPTSQPSLSLNVRLGLRFDVCRFFPILLCSSCCTRLAWQAHERASSRGGSWQ